jgi:hypothetical protein
MTTIRQVTSRIRNLVKASKQDAFLTDRFIYSLVMKHAKLLMRRQDSTNKLMKFSSVFKPLKFVELIDVNSAEADCLCINSTCTIKRTKDKVPNMIEGYFGPLIRSVTSLDYSQKLTPVYHASEYEKMIKQKTFKYNKEKYFWYLDGHLYFPNIEWDAVKLEGVFESNSDVNKYNCDTTDDCVYIQDMSINIPEFLFSEIEQLVFKDLGLLLQIPTDQGHDMVNAVR